MSKTLVIGSKGSMGARYCAILRHLREDFVGVDLGDEWPPTLDDISRVIVASPTDSHISSIAFATDILNFRGPILCEKPITKNSALLEVFATTAKFKGVDIRMVSNWIFALNRALSRVGDVAVRDEMEIEYNYYHSGNDGFFWDCTQPALLAGRFKYNRTSPIFDCKVNGNPVTLDDFSHSYPAMISEWLYADSNRLWTLEDAMKANRKVEAAMKQDPNPMVGEVDLRGVE